VLLVAAAPVAIVAGVARRKTLDIRTVLAALCVYVLLGMFWTFVYQVIDAIDSQPFFAQDATASTSDFVYFSFVTMTTTGYGDLTAANGLGRALAVLEALAGQLYLVTVVAVLVSQLGSRRSS
jgi:nucleoside permease NupC